MVNMTVLQGPAVLQRLALAASFGRSLTTYLQCGAAYPVKSALLSVMTTTFGCKHSVDDWIAVIRYCVPGLADDEAVAALLRLESDFYLTQVKVGGDVFSGFLTEIDRRHPLLLPQ